LVTDAIEGELCVCALQAEHGLRAGAASVVCAAGHSLGEYSALVFSGALALEDAAKLVVRQAL
jgi:malonyl CoA-acyl carrier protein transacylase